MADKKNEEKPKKVKDAFQTRNIALYIIAGLIIVTFIISGPSVIEGVSFFVQNLGKEVKQNDNGTISIPLDAQTAQNKDNPNAYVGKVLNEKIQLGRQDTFNNELSMIFSYQQLPAQTKLDWARASFDKAVNKIIGMYKARKMDIRISDETLTTEIGKRYFSVDGEVDYSLMKKNTQKVNQVLKSTMRDLMYERYVFDYFEGLPISKAEIETAYKLENSKIKIKYINLAQDEVDMGLLDQFYTQNKKNYTLYKLTRLVFEDEKTAQKSLEEARNTGSSEAFVEYGRKLEEEGKKVLVKFDADFSFAEDLGGAAIQDLVKSMVKGDIADQVVETEVGPVIFMIEDSRIGAFSEPIIQAQVKKDYVAKNRDTIESSNNVKAREIYEYAKTNGVDFISMVFPVKVETPEVSIQFMSRSFPNLDPDVTDDLQFMVKAFKADQGTILEPFKHKNGHMIVKIEEKESVDSVKVDEMYESLVKTYSGQKTRDLQTDYYEVERKKIKIVDNFDYVFRRQDFETQPLQ